MSGEFATQSNPVHQLPAPMLALAGTVVGAVILLGAIGPWLVPYDPTAIAPERALLAPSAQHWLGTDEDGADLLSVLISGARVACVVGFGTVLLSAALGATLGAISGYAGGWTDEAVMRTVEVVQSFPGVLLAILVLFLSPGPSEYTVIGALAATGWAGYARLIRGQVLTLREREFVLAARGIGASHARVLFVHLLPNTSGPLLVQATFGVAAAILAEASLSFLGLGPQGSRSWGALLDQGAVLFIKSPHVALAAGGLLAATVLAVNILGDALRARFQG